jgi:hypothetical protein
MRGVDMADGLSTGKKVTGFEFFRSKGHESRQMVKRWRRVI